MDWLSISKKPVISKKMLDIPQRLREKLLAAGQDHLLADWSRLDSKERHGLLDQLNSIDCALIHRLYESRNKSVILPARQAIEPVPVLTPDQETQEIRASGEASIARGEVAVLLVAGGQGTRLGFDHAKGLFPIGQVSGKSLFQIHAEKVLARSLRHGVTIPLVVLTSTTTHDETEEYFRVNRYFGLPPAEVYFVRQGNMPAVDFATGKLLLEDKGRIFMSPNGHGGVLTALAASGLLGELKKRGIKHLFYFQVDNPLVKVADPAFLGHHVETQSEASSKVVRKNDPAEKLGHLVSVGGRCTMIEYTDLPPDRAAERDDSGQLRLWAGSPAIHWFSLEFLERMSADSRALPYHLTRKKVPYFQAGRIWAPERDNAIKFEMFIFDILPHAEKSLAIETHRSEEFVPLKNAHGQDSPESVRAAMSALTAQWLEAAGVQVSRQTNGSPEWPLETSPTFALDREEFASRLSPGVQISGPTYFV
jgi:UDP-N-acetylglucosamine/UDP-N-acetylgalactosamine diphosphorylase